MFRKELSAATLVWSNTTATSIASGHQDKTQSLETARRHALENHTKDLKIVQELEIKLGVHRRWDSTSHEWQETGQLVAMRKYQRALDVVEGLIVARMFELTKMNRSQTGKFRSINNS